MGNSTPTTNFTSHLHVERDALRAFVTLLETEQQNLVGGHTEQLLTLAESKAKAVHTLNELASTRKNNLLSRGAKIETGGITTWLQAHAATSLCVWQDIQQLAEQAHHLNRTNGILIQSKLRHNQQTLTVLHNAASGANGLYGPNGQPHISISGRIFGSI
jgi:flagellar biosynthesis protein FlgN